MTNETDLKQLPDYIEGDIINPQKLALVHVTKYDPIWNKDHFEIPSTATATDYMYPRNTVHFTIGHHVSSHLFGNWDATNIMIVSPLQGVMDLNDKPYEMASVDTYFETYPDKNLVLPKDAHVFIPANHTSDLDGALFKTEGNKTLYKTNGYTEAEKKKIFKDAVRIEQERNRFTDHIHNGCDDVTEENFAQMPDGFFALTLKKNMLHHFLEDKGYLTDCDHRFSLSEIGSGAKDIEALGEYLGCRFSTSGNKGHYYHNFDAPLVGELFKKISMADFILHSDDYKIMGKMNPESKYSDFCFMKKGQKTSIEIYDTNDQDVLEAIDLLRGQHDYTQEFEEIEQTAQEENWTPAYQASFHIWKEKTLERLSKYYTLSKDFDFEAWQKKMDQRIADYAARYDKKDKKLLSDAVPARTPERAQKAAFLRSFLKKRSQCGSSEKLSAFIKRSQKSQ